MATIPDCSASWCRVLAFALAFSGLLLSSVFLQAGKPPKQKAYAVIFGTVWGPDDRPVGGVRVKIRRSSDKKARWEVYSSRRGEFEQLVPAGKETYVIWADTKGWKDPAGKHLQPGPEVTVQIQDKERAVTGLHLK